MNSAFHGFLDKFLVYLDDLLVFSKSLWEYVCHPKLRLYKLWAHKLYTKISKCEFASF